MTDTKKFTLSEIDAERAVVTYLNLVTQFENREEITLKKFSSYWNKLFSKGNCHFSDDTKSKAYNEATNILLFCKLNGTSFCILFGTVLAMSV